MFENAEEMHRAPFLPIGHLSVAQFNDARRPIATQDSVHREERAVDAAGSDADNFGYYVISGKGPPTENKIPLFRFGIKILNAASAKAAFDFSAIEFHLGNYFRDFRQIAHH